MSNVILVMGPPASGKSMKTKELIARSWVWEDENWRVYVNKRGAF